MEVYNIEMTKENFLDKWIEALPLNSKDADRKEMAYDIDLMIQNQALSIADISHSMIDDDMNSLEFLDMIKREWCVSEEQWKPFWNDLLTFARKYHKERKEYGG